MSKCQIQHLPFSKAQDLKFQIFSKMTPPPHKWNSYIGYGLLFWFHSSASLKGKKKKDFPLLPETQQGIKIMFAGFNETELHFRLFSLLALSRATYILDHQDLISIKSVES